MTDVAVVTLTRFPDIFESLRKSVDAWEPDALKVVVTSGGAAPVAPGWTVVAGVEPFVFARNANVGLRAAGDLDVLLVNDDCVLTGPVTEVCGALCDMHPNLGVLSPQIDGGVGNRRQRVGSTPPSYAPASGYYVSASEHLSFVCVYVPARTRALVGELDERYVGYGVEDRDYCRRVQGAGLELGVTPLCRVRHGFGGPASSASYRRLMSREEQQASQRRMHREFERKFGAA